MSFLDQPPPVPTLEGWKAVGGARLEWGVPNSSVDFDLLLLEQVLLDNEIECMFYPHRPNEGAGLGTVVVNGVFLFVPEERWPEAQRLAEELARSAPDWGEEAESAR